MNEFASFLRSRAAVAFLLIFTAGCSIGSALKSPAYVDTNTQLQLGVTRERVSEVLGEPINTRRVAPSYHLVDYHEFKSGTPGVTRLRVIGYLAGDIFTFGLSEFIFWPVEGGVLNARDYKAHVAYDAHEHLIGYRVVDGEGKVVDQRGNADTLSGG